MGLQYFFKLDFESNKNCLLFIKREGKLSKEPGKSTKSRNEQKGLRTLLSCERLRLLASVTTRALLRWGSSHAPKRHASWITFVPDDSSPNLISLGGLLFTLFVQPSFCKRLSFSSATCRHAGWRLPLLTPTKRTHTTEVEFVQFLISGFVP